MGQRIIGLTGGIATGKSTVSQYLAQHHGLPVLDADVFARQAVAPGTPILQGLGQRYGARIQNEDGTLNRHQLGQIIFHDPAEKNWVEAQIHPFVRQRFAEEMTKLQTVSTVIQAIPLLFESDLTHQVTEIWVVFCPEEMQLNRLMQRDGLSQTMAQARMNNQWPLALKLSRADQVLDNSGTLENLYAQVDRALG